MYSIMVNYKSYTDFSPTNSSPPKLLNIIQHLTFELSLQNFLCVCTIWILSRSSKSAWMAINLISIIYSVMRYKVYFGIYSQFLCEDSFIRNENIKYKVGIALKVIFHQKIWAYKFGVWILWKKYAFMLIPMNMLIWS